VFDATAGDGAPPAGPPEKLRGALLPVGNKIDRIAAGDPPPVMFPAGYPEPVYVSALYGQGLDELYDAIERAVWDSPHTAESEVAVSARHAALLAAALDELRAAGTHVRADAWELGAETLRAAVADLGRITGRTVEPDILDTIFSRFCIGK
jgi:tRNA modification GTPase